MHTKHLMSALCSCRPLRLLIFNAIACGCSTAWAAGGAHEHGAAELLLSSEGKDVQITFNAPAQSLVGFETAAVTEEQKTAVARAEASLMAPRDLFSLEGNSCALVDATVDVSSLVDVGNAPSHPETHADHSDEHADYAADHAGDDENNHSAGVRLRRAPQVRGRHTGPVHRNLAELCWNIISDFLGVNSGGAFSLLILVHVADPHTTPEGQTP